MTKILSGWIMFQLIVIGLSAGINYRKIIHGNVECDTVLEEVHGNALAGQAVYSLIPLFLFTDVEGWLYDYCVEKPY